MSQDIQHLYQRAGFGLSPREWQRLRGSSRRAAVDALFTTAAGAAPLRIAAGLDTESMSRSERRQAGHELARQYTLEWLDRMADQRESALLERLTLFWHDHFACRSLTGPFAIKQLNTLRTHALGSFRDLCLAVARDPSMIRYLNNQQNKKDSPNENFARELLELFTIGPGHYTERDVKEAARAFTGWSTTAQAVFRFRPGFHDEGPKTFMGKTGNFGGEDIINIILDRPAAAEFLVRKFWAYYVCTPPDEQRIEALSRLYFDSNYDTALLLRNIFTADWFYAPEVRAAQIKSPLVLTANLRRQLSITLAHPEAQLNLLRALGQTPFHPPNVAGWPGGRAWIDNTTLMLRLNLGAGLLENKEVDLRFREEPEMKMVADRTTRKLEATVDLRPLQNLIAGNDLAEDFTALCEYLLATPISVPIYELNRFINNTQGEERLRRMLLIIFSSPEYQVG